MKLITVAFLLLALNGAVAAAASGDQSVSSLEQATGTYASSLATMLVKFIFPIVSLLCVLYGIWHGVKNGKWDVAAMCIIAGLSLAVLPKMILKLFAGTSINLLG